MKSAIYIEQGVTQVMLTPENEWERTALNMVFGAIKVGCVSAWQGEFYTCQGGWDRWSPYRGESGDKSLIIRTEPTTRPADTTE